MWTSFPHTFHLTSTYAALVSSEHPPFDLRNNHHRGGDLLKVIAFPARPGPLRLGLYEPCSPVCHQYPLDELGWEADLVSIS